MSAPTCHAIYLASDVWECTCGGPTVITVGTWTGRLMVECVDCGAYRVIEDAS